MGTKRTELGTTWLFGGATISSHLESQTSCNPVGCFRHPPPATYGPGALAGVGGGTLDFMLGFRIIAVQGVGVGRDGVIAFGADGGHGHTCSTKAIVRQLFDRLTRLVSAGTVTQPALFTVTELLMWLN